MLLCTNGRNFLAKCGVEVGYFASSDLLEGKLRKEIWFASHPDTTKNILEKGDSGSPLYIPASGGNAYAVGIAIAKDALNNNGVYFHDMTAVLREIGATLVTDQ